jgi:hypothetical protein
MAGPGPAIGHATERLATGRTLRVLTIIGRSRDARPQLNFGSPSSPLDVVLILEQAGKGPEGTPRPSRE